MIYHFVKYTFTIVILALVSLHAHARHVDEFKRLEKAYPETIRRYGIKYITWKDGSRMLIRGGSTLIDDFATRLFNINTALGSISKDDVIHDRYEPIFRKMYGSSPAEVKKSLVTIYWMHNVFGKQYPLRIDDH